MQHVLLPYDGSVPSRNAVQHVIANHRKAGPVEVELVNVQADSHGIEINGDALLEQMRSNARSHGRNVLKPAVAEFEASGVKVRTHVEIGSPARTIASLADRLACDSIVMGTAGAGAVGALLLGSVSQRVIHLTQLPVTLIK